MNLDIIFIYIGRAISALRSAWQTVGAGLACVFLLLIFMFLGLMGYIFFLQIDTISAEEHSSIAYVTGKNHWQSMRYMHGGKVLVPVGKDDHYDLELSVDGKKCTYGTSKKNFDNVKMNDKAEVTYVLGRISERVYVKKFEFIM